MCSLGYLGFYSDMKLNVERSVASAQIQSVWMTFSQTPRVFFARCNDVRRVGKIARHQLILILGKVVNPQLQQAALLPPVIAENSTSHFACLLDIENDGAYRKRPCLLGTVIALLPQISL